MRGDCRISNGSHIARLRHRLETREYVARTYLPLVVILLLIHPCGCATPMAESPTLLVHAKNDPFADVPPAFQTDHVKIIYATDRVGEPTRDGNGMRYGYDRSRSLAFGTCEVGIGEGLPWQEITKQSRKHFRTKAIDLKVHAPVESGQYPETPEEPASSGDEPATTQDAAKLREEAEAQLHKLIAGQLKETSKKEAYIYVHGFNNSFDDSAMVIAQLWHFLGRNGVPLAYTWPAGSGLTLRGYNYDRESGEFTVFHLKQFLRAVIRCPEVEKIHLVAHSRGTDVLMSALRELVIAERAAGRSPRESLKISNVILAAPDMDFEVATQRISAEHLGGSFERFTVYMSENDKAIGIAGWLFASIKRIGQLRFSQLSKRDREAIEKALHLSLIDVRANTDWVGHNYFYSNPETCSDLILILRDNLDPGAANGRPLHDMRGNCWELHDGYPKFEE